MRRRLLITLGALVVAMLAMPTAQANHTFNDVSNSNIFHDNIDWLADTGITAGCNLAGDEFCPNQPVTRGQMAAFLNRTVEYLDAEPNPSTPRMFMHTSTAANVNSRRTVLDHPELNGNPNAVVAVTHMFNLDFIEEPIGTWYNGSRWTIFIQDGGVTSFPEDYEFAVTFIPTR